MHHSWKPAAAACSPPRPRVGPPGRTTDEPEFVDEPDIPEEGQDDDAPNPNRVMRLASPVVEARAWA